MRLFGAILVTLWLDIGSAYAAQFQCTACPCVMPSNMSSANTVEIIGGGSGGAGGEITAGGSGGGGGGGGLYAAATNMSLAANASINCQIGAGGTAGATGSTGGIGGDTVFNGTHTTVAACSGSELCAQGGQIQTGSGGFAVNHGGAGGATSFGSSVANAGGTGGTTGAFNNPGDGGGGAGGPIGVGANGGAATTNGGANGGAGGGGSDGGSAGGTSTGFSPGTPGGAGGANGSSIGAGGTGGAGGNSSNGFPGGVGTSENTWGLGNGPGAGGGGGGTTASGFTAGAGGAGSSCGGGGGGGSVNAAGAGPGVGGVGGTGCIFITYTPSGATPYTPGNGITDALLNLLFSPAHATTFSSAVAFTNTVIGCRFTVSLADGCTGAQAHGTIANLRLGDYQSVVDLAVDSGSGYTPGTYTWTSSGGGCTRNATGTITVSAGGLLGGQSGTNGRGTTYTITDGGAGCTSRPTIAIPVGAGAGTGGAIASNVFQLTPHNSGSVLGSTYSIAGVDYPVGYDTTLSLKDPSAAVLPAGATYDSSALRVTLAGSGGTLNGYDFSNSKVIEVTVPGWTITNNKFVCSQATSPHNQSQIQIDASVTSGFTIINFNYFDGGAGPNGVPCLTGGLTANVSSSQEGGNIVFDYNYCVNADSKCFNMNGLNASAAVFIEEKYNLYVNFGIAGAAASHGEAEYSFCGGAGIGQTYTHNAQFNAAYNQYGLGPTNLTSQFAFAEADGCHHLNDVLHYNFGIAFGNQPLTGSNNNNAQVSSAVQFCGKQEGGSVTNQVMTNNLHYYSGSFFPYNNTSGTCSSVVTPADYNAGTGNVCNLTSCN